MDCSPPGSSVSPQNYSNSQWCSFAGGRRHPQSCHCRAMAHAGIPAPECSPWVLPRTPLDSPGLPWSAAWGLCWTPLECCLGLRWTPLDSPGVLPPIPLDSTGLPWSAASDSAGLPWRVTLGDTALRCSPPLRLWVNITKIFFANLICWLFRFHVFGHLILFRTGDPFYATVNKIFWIFDYREDRKEKNILYRLKENCKM